MSQITDIEITRETIKDLITEARVKQGLSVNALERKARVPKDTIRDFERGKAYIIRVDKLQKILKALG